MNNLSWFIYFVQLADNVTSLFSWAAIGCFMAFLTRVGVTACRGESAWINTYGAHGADRAARAAVWKAFNPKIGQFVAATVAFALIAAVIPSRQTLLLIAGSEAGERFAKSDDVQSIVNPGMDLIRKWIKQESDKIKDKG